MQDQDVFNFLVRLADGIAETFGKLCETVIHEIDNGELKLVYIRNGNVTGRSVGDPTSLLGDRAYIKKVYAGKDLINFKAETKEGKLVKSTTVHMKSKNLHYTLGVNFDYTMLSLLGKTLEDIIKTGPEFETILSARQEISVEDIFQECLDIIAIPVAYMKKNDKYKLVEMLEQKALFSIQGSVPFVAEKLGVSRYTIYNYLRAIREKT